MKGNPQSRFALRDFCVDVATNLNSSKTPYLFALRVPVGGIQGAEQVFTVELLKYLTRQALQLRGAANNKNPVTEKSMALSCSRFQSAVSEAEWFQMLEAVLGGVVGTVYVIVELEIVNREMALEGDFSLLASFADFFAGLEQRRLKSRVKVLLVTCSPESPLYAPGELSPEVLLPVRGMLTSVRRRSGRGGVQGRGGRGMRLSR